LKKFINQGCLTMINVGNNRDISDFSRQNDWPLNAKRRL